MMSENKTGARALTPDLALDLVEMGSDEHNEYVSKERVNDILPPGLNSKMLYKDVVQIAWPSMVELTLTQLASMVDLMMVGQLGAWAISAVGLTTQPKFLLMTMFMAMNVGATAMVARSKGAGDPERANLFLRQAMMMTFVLSLTASILGYIFAEPLVRMMGAGAVDQQSLAGGVSYLRIQMIGLVSLALTSTATATLRGAGNSRTAMIYNLISNAINVVLNYLLIYGNFGFPRMEVAGASLATIIGQFVAFILSMRAITGGKNYLHLRLRDGFMPKKDAIASITKIGMPAMLEQLLMRAGMIIYARLVAGLGTVAYATHQICFNIQAMSFMNGQAFAISATSLTGQSLGKKRPDMAQSYTKRTRRVGMMVSVVLALVCFFLGGPIISLYTKETDIIQQGAQLMMIVALAQPLQSSQFILAGALRGAGDTRAIAIVTMITVLLVRPMIAYVAIYILNWGLVGAWIALVADQALRSLLVLLRYNSGKWKRIRV